MTVKQNMVFAIRIARGRECVQKKKNIFIRYKNSEGQRVCSNIIQHNVI